MILSVPGDKSVSQRALILAALTEGPTRITGLLGSADPRSTAAALRALSATIPPLPTDGSPIVVEGRGLRGLAPPGGPLDLGNSGTGARLLLGVLAGQAFSSTVTGDRSLRSRPMRRVTDPLAAMGARFRELGEPDRLPLEVEGGPLKAARLELPVASAQVKSALLLAGLVGGVSVDLTEPGRSRDHTERMLRAAGAPVSTRPVGAGMRVELPHPPEALRPTDWEVPGDFSSAAFFLVLALLGGAGAPLVIRDVGLNPTRTGLLDILGRMGARMQVEPRRLDDGVGEPMGLIRVALSVLEATTVEADEVPTAIDELPVLAVAATRAEGVTRITGAAELRVKETDRIAALAEGLDALGVEVEERSDGLEIRGTDAPLRGRVRSHGDHRIAMAFGVLGALPGNDVHVDEAEVVEVSYPAFWDDLRRVVAGEDAGSWRVRSAARAAAVTEAARSGGDASRGAVVTLDGPAGSGKSSTAREVARRLGYRHLDSGALYRALTWALLERGVESDAWPRLRPGDLARLDVRMVPVEGGFRILAGGQTLDDELRGPEVTARVSELAGLPAVRRWLLGVQRSAGARGGLVADGRDMGTVVFPDADVKVFLTADLAERARRRLRERVGGDGGDTDEAEPRRTPRAGDAENRDGRGEGEVREEAERIRERDRRDSERDVSPLRRPADATVLDTTGLEFEEQVRRVVDLVETRLTNTGGRWSAPPAPPP